MVVSAFHPVDKGEQIMRINKIKRRYAKMINDLPDNELLACIYMLCSVIIHRSNNTVTLEEVLTSILNLGKLIEHNKESEDPEC